MKARYNATSSNPYQQFPLVLTLIWYFIIVFSGYSHNDCTADFSAKRCPDHTNRNTATPTVSTPNAFEVHRFWLSLSNSAMVVGNTLIGYATGATQGVDSGIDALYFNDSPVALTSLIDEVEYIIQGRSLPFTDSDVVPMGFKTSEAGTYTIKLTNFDGLFAAGQAIFLKDTQTGVLHNLKTAAYTFSTQAGVFNNRFQIYYKSETIYQDGAWSNGIPTIEMNAIIADDYTTATHLTAQSITVSEGSVFTVASGTSLTVAGAIVNNSTLEGIPTFVVENDAVVLQTSNATNSGLFSVRRNSAPLFRYDYSLWATPVEGQNLRSFSPQTLFNRFYSYATATGVNGVYEQELFTATDVNTKVFQSAKGYLIRMPNNWVDYAPTAVASPYQGTFRGTLNNGNFSVPLSGAGAKFNLVGNPYPSPISISDFLTQNAASIEGTLYFYRKANSVANNASGYATYTAMGLVSADPTLNNGNLTSIQTGQGFFVVAKSDTPAPLVFTNTMRTSGATTFFKSPTEEQPERNRYWLNLSNESNQLVGQTLVGYATNATDGIDPGIDAAYFNDSATALTSLLHSKEYIIQGRSLPFDPTDTVALGFKSEEGGSFTIGLADYDGLFAAQQDLFLKDKQTQTLHNLKDAAYTFDTPEGTFNNRFEIQYNSTLGTATTELLQNTILIGVQNQQIKINSGNIPMDKIELIDLSGRILYSQIEVGATHFTIDTLSVSNQLLIVRITTKEKEVLNKKIVF